MISNTNLSLIPGTEIVEHNGERGIFVPMADLVPTEYFGKQTYSLICSLHRRSPNKKNPNSHTLAVGRLRFPEWSKDKRLESTAYLDKSPVVQWITNPLISIGGTEGVMDASFLTDILDR